MNFINVLNKHILSLYLFAIMLFVLCTETTHTHIQALFQLILQKRLPVVKYFYTSENLATSYAVKFSDIFLPTHSSYTTYSTRIYIMCGFFLVYWQMRPIRVKCHEHKLTYHNTVQHSAKIGTHSVYVGYQDTCTYVGSQDTCTSVSIVTMLNQTRVIAICRLCSNPGIKLHVRYKELVLQSSYRPQCTNVVQLPGQNVRW